MKLVSRFRSFADEPEHSSAVSLLLAFVGAFALAAVATALDGWPPPRVFDEFSLILQGQTFALWRLTNPPHPLPQFFETIHVLQQPTYSSKYFPGNGPFFALGILLGGGARLGQWIAFASMAPALLWMLRGYFASRTAPIATALFIILIADSTWASGYWGASMTVTGSALLFGALPRLFSEARARDAALMGVGLSLMALTRPFESLMAALAPALVVTPWLFLDRADGWRRLRVVAIPSLGVLAAAAVLLLAHNRAATGTPFRTPYSLYEADAPGAPPFIWQAPNEPTKPLRVNEKVRLKIDMQSYENTRGWWRHEMQERLFQQTIPYYLPHALFLAPLLLLPLVLRERRFWLPMASVASVALATTVSAFFLPHYPAPAIPPLLILFAAACALASTLTISKREVGRGVTSVFLALLGTMGLWRLAQLNEQERDLTLERHWSRRREDVALYLRDQPGKQLVFVTYGPTYQQQDEWVQNDADLRATKVLWAHDLGEQENARLVAMEQDRTVWRLTVERPSLGAPCLTPYNAPGPAKQVAPNEVIRPRFSPPY